MVMDDYKPNSHTYREQQKQQESNHAEKKVEKVVKNPVKIKKKNEISKFADVFISDDAANVKNYIWMDLLVPTIKETLFDIIKNSADMILFGGSGGRRDRDGRRDCSRAPYVSYRDEGNRSRRDDRRTENDRPRSRFDLDTIEFKYKGEAEDVLDKLRDLIDSDYRVATVGDLYDMVGEAVPYTANNYGWTNLRNAYVERLRGGGYIIKLPRPMPID